LIQLEKLPTCVIATIWPSLHGALCLASGKWETTPTNCRVPVEFEKTGEPVNEFKKIN